MNKSPIDSSFKREQEKQKAATSVAQQNSFMSTSLTQQSSSTTAPSTKQDACADSARLTALDQEKRALRKRMLSLRDAMDYKIQAAKSTDICRQAIHLISAWQQEHMPANRMTIGVYFPMGSEVDIQELINWTYQNGHTVAFPYLIRKDYAAADDIRTLPIMRFRTIPATHYHDACQNFIGKPLKTWDPTDAALEAYPACEPNQIDALVVPLVAFDQELHRLGYGGACYDRLLPRLRGNVLVSGVAFCEQQTDSVPHDNRDIPLPRIIKA